jgi:hypothetical protein
MSAAKLPPNAEPIKPDPQDYEAVEAEHGRLHPNASDAACAKHYQLAQATKLLRLWEQGKRPLPVMWELDALAREQKRGRR